MDKSYTAALIVIGNEILSGRTQDKNINYIANKMVDHGIALVDVRIIPDVEEDIIATVRALKDKVTYLFTTGGIGPTHDDITSENVAKALDIPLEKNEQAYEMLETFYGKDAFTPPRQKMAYLPRGAELIPNPISTAPGFISENVYVLAGVPSIMQAMIEHVVCIIEGGDVVLSKTVSSSFPETVLAEELSRIQECYKGQVEIGSYPYFKDGGSGVNIVLRSSDEAVLDRVVLEVEYLISSRNASVLTLI